MKTISQQDIDAFDQFISSHEYFFVSGHKEPDGDCIASCLGIGAILEKKGKPYQLLSAGPFKRTEIQKYEHLFSDTMNFLDESERRKTGLIITDCSQLSRIGDIDGDLKNLDTFVIDHHKTSDLENNAAGFIDPASPACSYLIQIFYEKIIGDLPEDVAKVLFFGSCTDTGYFKFLDNNSAEFFEATARLVKYGANPRETYNTINNGKSYSTRKLLGVLLNKAEQYLGGKLIITSESMEDTKKFGAEGRDSDALYQLLLSVKNVEAVVFIRQDSISTCTGGFRSLDKVDVSAIAAKFGGGGHKNAAGMSTEGRIETLIPAIVKEFARILK